MMLGFDPDEEDHYTTSEEEEEEDTGDELSAGGDSGEGEEAVEETAAEKEIDGDFEYVLSLNADQKWRTHEPIKPSHSGHTLSEQWGELGYQLCR
jgi:hypothetical protein